MLETTDWHSLVSDAKDCICGWLDYTGMTIDIWDEICCGDREYWQGHDADYWRLSFANSILDDVDPLSVPSPVLSFWKNTAEEEGRYDEESTDEDISYASAEVAWREAVWEAEELLSKSL